MKNSLTNLRASLEQAVSLIDASLLLPSEAQSAAKNLTSKSTKLDFSETSSLLDKCDSVNEKYNESKPVIRIIHHFACSGGTLVSKCLSAMPNVFLLSEVHPHSDLQRNKVNPQYSPSDLAKLAMYAAVPEQKKLAEKIFIESIKTAHAHINQRGGTLVIRDHSHSDYCVSHEIHQNTVAALLSEYFKINSIVTIRNPIDSYLSLVANGWVHFQPKTFDEYCIRLLAFLRSFKQHQIVFYEDFVFAPKVIIKEISTKLLLSYDDDFEAILELFSVTGDSGRKGVEIKERKRRIFSSEFLSEVENSENFEKITDLFPKYKLS